MLGFLNIRLMAQIGNRLISFLLDDNNLLEKYETIQTKTEDLQNIELNFLPAYDDRYIKTKARRYGEKFDSIFCSLDVPEDETEYECLSHLFFNINVNLFYRFPACL